MGQFWLDGYSAQVEVYLLVDGRRYNVAQIGRGSFLLRDAGDIPPGTDATLVVKIDGHEQREEIFLCEGAMTNEEPVPFF